MVMTIISYVLNWWSWVVSKPPSFLHVFPWPSFQKKGERWSWKVSKPPIDDYSWPSIQYFLEMMVTTIFFGHFCDKVLGFEASRPSRYDARIHLSHQNQGSLLKIWNGPRITLVSRSHISPFSFFGGMDLDQWCINMEVDQWFLISPETNFALICQCTEFVPTVSSTDFGLSVLY